MKKNKFNENEFKAALEKLSTTIQASIQRINPQKLGLEPEDIAQEIRIKLWKIFQSEKIISNYSSYLKKAINSIIIDQIRASRRYERTIDHEKQRTFRDTSLGHNPVNIRDEIVQAIDTLSESRRAVVKLFFLGLDIEEIASMLDKSESSTRNLLYRGLSDLKERTTSKGVDLND